eukprot:s105_g5.t2
MRHTSQKKKACSLAVAMSAWHGAAEQLDAKEVHCIGLLQIVCQAERSASEGPGHGFHSSQIGTFII